MRSVLGYISVILYITALGIDTLFGSKFQFFGEASAHCFTDPELQEFPQDEFNIVWNVLELGFESAVVFKLMTDKYLLTGTPYLCQSELISDLLQLEEEISNAEESRGRPDSHTRVLGEWLTSYSLHLEHC